MKKLRPTHPPSVLPVWVHDFIHLPLRVRGLSTTHSPVQASWPLRSLHSARGASYAAMAPRPQQCSKAVPCRTLSTTFHRLCPGGRPTPLPQALCAALRHWAPPPLDLADGPALCERLFLPSPLTWPQLSCQVSPSSPTTFPPGRCVSSRALHSCCLGSWWQSPGGPG